MKVVDIKVDNEGCIYVLLGSNSGILCNSGHNTFFAKLTSLGDVLFSKYFCSYSYPVGFAFLRNGSTAVLIVDDDGVSVNYAFVATFTSEGEDIGSTYFDPYSVMTPKDIYYDEDEDVLLVGGSYYMGDTRRQSREHPPENVKPGRREINSNWDSLLIKMSRADFKVQWAAQYRLTGSYVGDEFVKVLEYDDESYLVVGNSDVVVNSIKRTNMTFSRVNKTDGSIMHTYVIGGTNTDEIMVDFCELSDGSFAFHGDDNQGSSIFVGRVSFDGDGQTTLHWIKKYEISSGNENIYPGMCAGGDNGSIYVVVTYHYNPPGRREVAQADTLLLLKYGNDGELLLQKAYPSASFGNAVFFNTVEDDEAPLYFGGDSEYDVYVDGGGYLARASLNGSTCPDHSVEMNLYALDGNPPDDYFVDIEEDVTMGRWDMQCFDCEWIGTQDGEYFEIFETEEFCNNCYDCEDCTNCEDCGDCEICYSCVDCEDCPPIDCPACQWGCPSCLQCEDGCNDCSNCEFGCPNCDYCDGESYFYSQMNSQCYFCDGEWNEEGACHENSDSEYSEYYTEPSGGVCVAEDTCHCFPGYDVYDPVGCTIWTCNGILSNDTENPDMCHGEGNCIGYNKCFCWPNHDLYFGSDCQYTYCGISPPYGSDEPEVCSGNGTCWPYGVCQCDERFYGVNCEVTECNGILSNDTSKANEICNGLGTCVGPEICECQFNLNPFTYCVGCASGWFPHWSSPDCNVTTCQDIWSNDTANVCNFGNGTCVSPDFCVCDEGGIWAGPNCQDCIEGRYGVNCDIPTCYGIIGNYTNGITDANGNETCSGHGECKDIDDCGCFDYELWEGETCDIPLCFGVSSLEDELVCWGKGDCTYSDSCVCEDGYYGSNCMERIGNPVFTDSLLNRLTFSYFLLADQFTAEKVELKDGDRFNCSKVVSNWVEFLTFNSSWCQFSFVSADVGDDEPLEFCELLIINIIDEDDIFSGDEVRRGDVLPEEYQVPVNFTLEMISVTYPEVVIKLEVETYVEPEIDDGGGGGDVEDEVTEPGSSYIWAAIVFPILFCVFIGFGCLFFCCLCLLCILAIIALLVCLVCGGSGSSLFLYHQKKAISKFEQLDNFDLLLSEQKLMKSNTAPRIKIKKELFEVDSKKIKLISVLGDGGSEAVVYKAEWAGKIVAFKSFKSRSVCGSQMVMDEFEREASLMSSISHPNIIRFFGCALKDPRIGFVMEYCSNGDLADYMDKKHTKKEVFLFQEKVRMMCEISSAMAYLHGRKVIHRDLKLENVLLDDELSCKVMDFGISRVFEQTKQAKTKGIGTSIYISPEMVMGSMYNEKCDVYSMAILCHILFYENQHPYGLNCEYVEAKVASNPYFRPKFKRIENTGMVGYSHPIPKWLKELISNMWHHDAFSRKSFVEINKFLTEIIASKKDKLTQFNPASVEEEDQQQQHENEANENDATSSSQLLFYMKLSSQNVSKAEQFHLGERNLKSLMKLVKEKYPPPRYNVKRLLMFSDEESNVDLAADKVLETDEDVAQWVTNDCLVDVEEYDQRDQELEGLKKENSELIRKVERIHGMLVERARIVKQIKAKVDPLRYSKLLEEEDQTFENLLPLKRTLFVKKKKEEDDDPFSGFGDEDDEDEEEEEDYFGGF